MVVTVGRCHQHENVPPVSYVSGMNNSRSRSAFIASPPPGRPESPPRLTDRQSLGRRGEDLAAQWYVSRGGTVVDRNWRDGRHGELDLIVALAEPSDGPRVLVICEVKARSSTSFGLPAEAVGWDKQRRIRRLAAAWLSRNPGYGHVRFDVASVVQEEVSVIEAAF